MPASWGCHLSYRSCFEADLLSHVSFVGKAHCLCSVLRGEKMLCVGVGGGVGGGWVGIDEAVVGTFRARVSAAWARRWARRWYRLADVRRGQSDLHAMILQR